MVGFAIQTVVMSSLTGPEPAVQGYRCKEALVSWSGASSVARDISVDSVRGLEEWLSFIAYEVITHLGKLWPRVSVRSGRGGMRGAQLSNVRACVESRGLVHL